MDTVVIIGGGAALYPALPDKMAYGLAAILVSWLWFFPLSVMGKWLGQMKNQLQTLTWINRISATVMWLIAGRYLIQLSQSVGIFPI